MKRLAQDYEGAWFVIPEEKYDEFQGWRTHKLAERKKFEPPAWAQPINLHELRFE